MTIFDHKYEAMPREQIAQVQIERLQALLARMKRNVRRFRERTGDVRVESLVDLPRLPLTQPQDLLDGFPYGMFALPLREVVRLHSTVGLDGRQLVIGHTRNDLAQWGRLTARQLVAVGITSHDLIQISLGGAVPGASGYALGAELIESAVIPEDPLHIEYQLAMLQNYRVTAMITTPSNARELADVLEARRIDPHALGLQTVLLSRPVGAAEREALAHGLSANICCSFGVAEVLDPGLCVECTEGRFHVNEDQFVVESVEGELVVTTLCREAMPLVRYCTRVTCAIRAERCPCGRTGAVLVPGERRDGRMRVNEMPLYPAQIAAVLARTRAGSRPFHLEVSERGIVVALEVTKDLFADTMKTMEALKREIQSEFLSRLGVQADVRYVSPRDFQTLPAAGMVRPAA